jgi:transcription initiation factor TFIID TATA-box-binding protein
MEESTIEVVNIAAVGDLESEVDIEQVTHDSDLPVSNFDPEYNAAFLRFEDDGELVILYTSGKYILRGGDEFENMHRVNDQFLTYLDELGVEFQDPNLEIKNVVAVGNLERDQSGGTDDRVGLGKGRIRTRTVPWTCLSAN